MLQVTRYLQSYLAIIIECFTVFIHFGYHSDIFPRNILHEILCEVVLQVLSTLYICHGFKNLPAVSSMTLVYSSQVARAAGPSYSP